MPIDIQKTFTEFSKILPKFPDGRIDYSSSDRALVLTCFVKYQDKILLLQRSNKVGTYKRMWNSVAGFIDEAVPIEEKIMEELQEELGITKDMLKNLKIGEAYQFHDAAINKTWIIVPCLAELHKKPEIKLDWEHIDYTWIQSEEIANFNIVPNLDKSLKNILHAN